MRELCPVTGCRAWVGRPFDGGDDRRAVPRDDSLLEHLRDDHPDVLPGDLWATYEMVDDPRRWPRVALIVATTMCGLGLLVVLLEVAHREGALT